MSGLYVNLLIVIVTFFGMEGVAWLTHRYVMHGFLWNLHSDHHKKEVTGFFEKNDYFFVIFAVPGMLGLMFGGQANYNWLFWIGLGITIYGIAYFFVHDIFIHQRFKIFRNANQLYFRAIRRGHKMHHKHLGKEEGECFGMLWVPYKYFKEARSK